MPGIPSVPAVRVYPSPVSVVRGALAGAGVKTASVAADPPDDQSRGHWASVSERRR